MMSLDAPFNSDDHFDYAASYAEDEAREADALRRFYWLTASERSVTNLANEPAFPGLFAESAALDSFAKGLKRHSSRIVPCRFDLGYAKLAGSFDLVTGIAYFMDNGRQVVAKGLPDARISVEFAEGSKAALHYVKFLDGAALMEDQANATPRPSMTLGQVMHLRSIPVSPESIAAVVERLAGQNALPPVTMR